MAWIARGAVALRILRPRAPLVRAGATAELPAAARSVPHLRRSSADQRLRLGARRGIAGRGSSHRRAHRGERALTPSGTPSSPARRKPGRRLPVSSRRRVRRRRHRRCRMRSLVCLGGAGIAAGLSITRHLRHAVPDAATSRTRLRARVRARPGRLAGGDRAGHHAAVIRCWAGTRRTMRRRAQRRSLLPAGRSSVPSTK